MFNESRRKLMLQLTFSAAFAVFCFWVIMWEVQYRIDTGVWKERTGKYGQLHLFLLPLAVPLMPYIVLVLFRRLGDDQSGVLRLSPSGITDLRSSHPEIPWAAVTDVQLLRYRHRMAKLEILEIKLDRGALSRETNEPAELRKPGRTRWLIFTAQDFEAPFRTVIAGVESYFRAHGHAIQDDKVKARQLFGRPSQDQKLDT